MEEGVAGRHRQGALLQQRREPLGQVGHEVLQGGVLGGAEGPLRAVVGRRVVGRGGGVVWSGGGVVWSGGGVVWSGGEVLWSIGGVGGRRGGEVWWRSEVGAGAGTAEGTVEGKWELQGWADKSAQVSNGL